MKRSMKIAAFIAIPVIIAGTVIIYNHLDTRNAEPVAGSPQQQGGGNNARKIPVTVFIADYITLDEGKSAIGTLLPNEEVDIASEVAGKIEGIFFEEGSRVKMGQVLVKVNDDDLQSQLQRAKYQRNLLKEKLERSRILLDKDAISREAFDQVETDYNMVETDIQLLEVRIDKTSIKAPFDGTTGFRYVSPGSYLQPGTKIAHLVDNSLLKVEFSIGEKFYNDNLRNGIIHFTTENDRVERTARIYAIDPNVDPKTRNIIIRAIYTNTGLNILPGMMARVVVGKKSGESLQVPTEAIVPDASDKKVWLVRDGKAHLQSVSTGIRTENMIEVTKGLIPGDSVVITGLMQMKEGVQLIITN